jgi:predicted Zn-dependent peptidase
MTSKEDFIKSDINGYNITYIKCSKNIRGINKDVTRIHIYVRAGMIHETEKETGIAHLLEHIILDSWVKCKGNCTKYFSKKGVLSNAHTHCDYTEYHITGLSRYDDIMYDYMSSIISKPHIDEKCLYRAKQAVTDELLNGINNRSWSLHDALFKNISDNIGIANSSDFPKMLKNLNQINLEDILMFYRKWYRPENVFFFVISNKNPSGYLKKYLHHNEDSKQDLGKDPKQNNVSLKTKTNYVFLSEPRSKKTKFLIGFTSENNIPRSDVIYYDLIKHILCTGLSSYLYLTLRDKMNLIYDIQYSYEIIKSNNDIKVVSAFATSSQFKNSENLLKNFISLLNKFIKGSYDISFLNRAKQSMLVVYSEMCRSSSTYVTNFYGSQMLLSSKDDKFFDSDTSMKMNLAMTQKDLAKISRRLFKDIVIITETK